jgi:hypothetical protein
MQDEVDQWGETVVYATAPLTLIDLRTAGLIRLGVSTEAARGKAQAQGRGLSQAVYDQTNDDGLIYLSRLTGQTCVCVYERALPGPLIATAVVKVAQLAGFVSALRHLNVIVIASR